MNTDKIVFAHIRVATWAGMHPYGGVTLAMHEEDGAVKLGIAVCHEHDRYVKAEGRNRARGRLHSRTQENAKFRAELPSTSVAEVFRVINGDERNDVLEQELTNILRKAGAPLV
jgi:hypothetical protein